MPSVLVCRGCCCDPSDAVVKRLTDAAKGETKVRVTDCLGPCEQKDVVVVPTENGRVWLSEMSSDERVDALVSWLQTGGTLPPVVTGHQFPAPRPARGPQGERVDVDIAGLANDASIAWTIGVDGAVFELMPGHEATIALDTDDGVGVFRVTGGDGVPTLLLLARQAAPTPVDVASTADGWRLRTCVAEVVSPTAPTIDEGILELERPLPEQSALPAGWVLGAAAWLMP